MNQVTNPIALQRKLQLELKRARLAAQLSYQAVSRAVGFPIAKIINMEVGAVSAEPADLKVLFAHYGNLSTEIVELIHATVVQERAWWGGGDWVFSMPVLKLLKNEISAVGIKYFSREAIPGILQTMAYAEAQADLYDKGWVNKEDGVKLRTKRSSIFVQPNGLNCQFIIEETVLYRTRGSEAVMYEQLCALQEFNKLPNVSIQVLGLNNTYASRLTGNFGIYDFGLDNPDYAIYREFSGETGQHFYGDPVVTARYLEEFSILEAAAYPSENLDTVLDRIIEERNYKPAD